MIKVSRRLLSSTAPESTPSSAADRPAREQTEHRIGPDPNREDSGRIRASAEERGMAQRDESAIPDQQIERHRQRVRMTMRVPRSR